jgi:hypothetical protein
MPISLNLPLHLKVGEGSNRSTRYKRVPYGKEMLKQFSFDPEYRNVNHGTYDKIQLSSMITHKRQLQAYIKETDF